MKIKTIKKISKKTVLIFLGIILGAGITVFAATGEWRGTDKMRGGEIVKAYDILNNFEFLKGKMKKYSCPSGESIQELDLNAGTFKCTSGGSRGGGGSDCSRVINKCNNNATFWDINDNDGAYRWKCGTETCAKSKAIKRYQPPTITEVGLSYKCIGGLNSCLVIERPELKNCFQAGASDDTGVICVSSRPICKTSFAGPIWGTNSGDPRSCIKGTGVNADRLWREQGSVPAPWCRGRADGISNWIRDNVVTIYNQECR